MERKGSESDQPVGAASDPILSRVGIRSVRKSGCAGDLRADIPRRGRSRPRASLHQRLRRPDVGIECALFRDDGKRDFMARLSLGHPVNRSNQLITASRRSRFRLRLGLGGRRARRSTGRRPRTVPGMHRSRQARTKWRWITPWARRFLVSADLGRQQPPGRGSARGPAQMPLLDASRYPVPAAPPANSSRRVSPKGPPFERVRHQMDVAIMEQTGQP